MKKIAAAPINWSDFLIILIITPALAAMLQINPLLVIMVSTTLFFCFSRTAVSMGRLKMLSGKILTVNRNGKLDVIPVQPVEKSDFSYVYKIAWYILHIHLLLNFSRYDTLNFAVAIVLCMQTLALAGSFCFLINICYNKKLYTQD